MVERDRSQQDARRVTDLQLAAGPVAGRCGILFAHLSNGAQRLFEGLFEVCDLDPVAVDDDAVGSNDIEIAVHSYPSGYSSAPPLLALQCGKQVERRAKRQANRVTVHLPGGRLAV